MNIFYVPSWYPSASNPIYGIFNREQAELFARERPDYKIGVSTWGQGDYRWMLPASRISSFQKYFKQLPEKSKLENGNLTTYFSPAFTWTRKWRAGNIEGIRNANKENLAQHINQYGKPDIICAQASYPASVIARDLSRELDVPYTVTIYMSPFPFDEFLNRDGSLSKLIKEPLQQASRLFASCNALTKHMESFGLSNTSVMHLPVDTDYFIPASKVENETVQIFAHGRLEDQKGFDLLLEAVSKISQPFQLRIGGDGSRREEYHKLADSLGVADKVTWLGLLDKAKTREEMQSCDFFVLSSRHETFGIVQVEAMACGKPVVATKCGGPEDIITPESGILCDVDDVESLRTSISNMIDNYSQFSDHKIRERAVEHFGQKPWVIKMESIFQELI